MALIRDMVLDGRRPNGKAVQHIRLPKPTVFPACKEYPGMMKDILSALEVLQDPEVSE